MHVGCTMLWLCPHRPCRNMYSIAPRTSTFAHCLSVRSYKFIPSQMRGRVSPRVSVSAALGQVPLTSHAQLKGQILQEHGCHAAEQDCKEQQVPKL